MAKKYKAMTAEDFAKELEADPEYQERKRVQEAYWAERRRQLDEDQKEIVAQINAAGIPIRYVHDLIPMRTPYPAAIPILLEHLALPHMPNIMDMIARSLAVPEAEYAHDRILRHLREDVAKPRDEKGVKGALDGLTVAVSLTKPKARIKELLEHAKDESLGDSRLLFLMRLRRSKDPEIVEGLIGLAADPFFQTEMRTWKGFAKKHGLVFPGKSRAER
jgi:hypothetical protein